MTALLLYDHNIRKTRRPGWRSKSETQIDI
nr:MAG TPA: hypothetical protein [Caudoviricetes sp.]